MSLEPITRAEFDALLREQLAALEDGDRAVYQRYQIDPEIVGRVFETNPENPWPSYVIARSGSHVLYYDDIEEEWGTADLASDGLLHDWGTWSDRLFVALRNFPIPEAFREQR